MKDHRLFYIFAAIIMLLLPAGFIKAQTGTIIVTPSNTQGWTIAPNGTVAINWAEGIASTGTGSIQFGPISGANPANKFIMYAPYAGAATNFQGISYDFYIASLNASHFYLNIYVDDGNAATTNWYDCRYDFVPTGAVGSWNTLNVTGATTPTNVAAQGGATCPATLAGLGAGNTIFLIAINGGQSNASDAGLAGGFDNVTITTATGATTYDFETGFVVTADGRVLIPLDNRINNFDAGAPIAAYGIEYEIGDEVQRGLHVYDIYGVSEGRFIWEVTPDEIDLVDPEPAENTLIAQTRTDTLVLLFWRLNSGEFQINVIMPNGKMYVLIFNELFTSGGYTSFEYIME